MFVLKVRLSVVTYDPISIGRWRSLLLSRGDFSSLDIVETLEKTLTQVHIADRINTFGELNRAWQLAVSVAPVMLDTLHMPLVDDDNDSLALGLINLFEELFVLLIDENSLELREESSACLRVPINLMLIQAFLGEGSWTHK